MTKTPVIVRSFDPILLVGAGDVSASDMALAHRPGWRVVAADGGAARCLEAGVVPEAVIGDLDSLEAGTRAALPAERVFPVAEQESTDFEKCLERVSAPVVVAVGFAGPRIDHTLAVCTSLLRHAAMPVIVLGEADLIFHGPREVSLDLAPGTRVSLYPLRQVTGRSEGLRWPIGGIGFAPDGRIGTSNEALGPVHLGFDGPGMLVITPRAALESVLAALGGPRHVPWR